MYKFKVDRENRILFIDLEEFISNEETLKAAKDFWVNIANVGRGAVIICDITKFKSGTRVSRILLQKVMKLVESYEPRAVIRIIDAFNGAMIFDRAYKSIDAKYKIYRVGSMDQAMEIVNTVDEIPPVFKNPPLTN
jgi:hypothetical protein